MKNIRAEKVLGHTERLRDWKDGYSPPPVTVEFDLSNRCILGCQDCHFAYTHVRGPWAQKIKTCPPSYANTGDLADTAMVERVLNEMAEVRGIVWSGGGEPTTHPDWLHIMRTASIYGLKQGMYTCGGLLTKETGADLAKLAEWVVVSLDAVDSATYFQEKKVHGFDKAVKGIDYLVRNAECTVGVSFLLHAKNWRSAPTMLGLAYKHGASYITFRPAIRTDASDPSEHTEDCTWINDAMPMLEDLADNPNVILNPDRFKRYRDWKGRQYPTCYGVRMNTTITPDGRMWMCPQHRGVPGSCIGDLSKEHFLDVWSKHPGQWTDFSKCRVMCRLHMMNEVLADVFDNHTNPEFL